MTREEQITQEFITRLKKYWPNGIYMVPEDLRSNGSTPIDVDKPLILLSFESVEFVAGLGDSGPNMQGKFSVIVIAKPDGITSAVAQKAAMASNLEKAVAGGATKEFVQDLGEEAGDTFAQFVGPRDRLFAIDYHPFTEMEASDNKLVVSLVCWLMWQTTYYGSDS